MPVTCLRRHNLPLSTFPHPPGLFWHRSPPQNPRIIQVSRRLMVHGFQRERWHQQRPRCNSSQHLGQDDARCEAPAGFPPPHMGNDSSQEGSLPTTIFQGRAKSCSWGVRRIPKIIQQPPLVPQHSTTLQHLSVCHFQQVMQDLPSLGIFDGTFSANQHEAEICPRKWRAPNTPAIDHHSGLLVLPLLFRDKKHLQLTKSSEKAACNLQRLLSDRANCLGASCDSMLLEKGGPKKGKLVGGFNPFEKS